ncbi:MAG: DUF4861 domain-containing protein [Candidatus Azobacteroides sp.]|nr:DUF4861 domain-containing protein [Candidatus Azobacteroides sp.]
MKSTTKITFLLIFSFLVCFSTHAQFIIEAGKKNFEIVVTNLSNTPKENAPVVLKLSDVIIKSATVWDKRQEIPSQLDDLDANGTFDELAFVINMKPLEAKKLKIELSVEESVAGRYPNKVHAQLLEKDSEKSFKPVITAASETGDLYNAFHHHGPAFESELMAYRIYFDQKQTVDLYGKKIKRLELQETNWYPTDEQLEKKYGDDILRVSGSVGVGTLKGWNGKKAIHISPVDNRDARIISNGPVRTIVDMTSHGWEYMGEKFTMVSRYIMYAGHRDVEVMNILFQKEEDEVKMLPKDILFATGVQKLPDSELFTDNDGLLGIWGTDWPVNDTIKYAKETVGLGVFVPKEYISEKNVEDNVNHLFLLNNNEDFQISYYITAAAEKEEFGYKNPEDFFKYLEAWKEDILNPVKIRMLRD